MRGERGHAAVEFGLALAFLMLPVAIVVLAFGPWSERRVLAEAAAAESARAVVLTLDHVAGAATVERMTSQHGIEESGVRLGWCDATPTGLFDPAGLCQLERGGVVTANVQVWTPLFVTPWGEIGGLWVSAVHSEPIDLYRSMG